MLSSMPAWMVLRSYLTVYLETDLELRHFYFMVLLKFDSILPYTQMPLCLV